MATDAHCARDGAVPRIEVVGGRCGGTRSVGSSAAPEEVVEMAWHSWRHAGESTDGLLGSEHGHDGALLQKSFLLARCFFFTGGSQFHDASTKNRVGPAREPPV